MVGEIKELLRGVLEDDELFEIGAKMVMKAYEALKKEGFSHDDAMAILAGNVKSKSR